MKSQAVNLELMLGALLRIPFEAINEQITMDLAAAGHGALRARHFQVFQHLPADGARLTDLAEGAQITKQSMATTVGFLVNHGYLERFDDPSDARAQILKRTDRGWEVERIARATIRALEVDWGAKLGPERMRQCIAFLTELANMLQSEQPNDQDDPQPS